MATLLKKSTTEVIEFGPFLDSTDGNTEETGLSLVTADILVSKNHAALTAKNDATDPTGGTNAHYQVTLNATDTGTLGRLRVYCHKSGALAVWEDFEVVTANVYNSLVAGSDILDVSVTQWAGTGTTISATSALPEVDAKSISDNAAAADSVQANIGNLDTATSTLATAANLATVDTVVDGIQTDLSNGTDGLGVLKTLIDTVNTDLSNGTDGLSALKALIDAVNTDLSNGTDGLGAIKTDTAAILLDTLVIGAAGAGLTAVPWNAAWDAEVQSEVDDALDTEISELGVAVPNPTPTVRTAIMLIYMALRNKLDITDTSKEIHNNAGTVIAKKTLSDDGTIYSEAEMVQGP